jgi:adenosylhomocysteine nucleosidase
MKILVTFAVHAEFAAWRRKGQFRQVARRPFPLYAGEAGGSSVRALLTGIGQESASEAIRWGLSRATDLCISSGFTGALHSDLCTAELLAARVVCRAGRELAVASDRHLFAAACELGARPVDRFMTAPGLVTSVAEKSVLSGEADAVDMESYVILAEAARRGVRAVSIRAVSDSASSALPFDFDRMRDERGGIRIRALLLELLRRPQQLGALLRLARDCRMAGRQLAEFLESYVQVLDAGLDRSESAMVAAL